ncbi:MAG: type transport system ATP-binding protein [Acidimicrobiaceae bacterium]|nr:type transport system ATP-binding protein [Acidimicrobiaceae bacterium]
MEAAMEAAMSGTGTAVIEVRGLCKRYGERLVVDNVDLDVGQGEIVGLLGANGAGKTTTVECIQGLRDSDAGTIRVLGMDPAVDGPRLRSLVGSQLQASALPDRLRVSEAVELFRRPGSRSASGLLSAFGLADQRKTSFSALSGGQQQRLFLTLALLNQPKLVILDELTQGLDPAARRDVWNAILSLRDAGTTVLLVTHYMDEAEALCDRVVVLRGGRVVDAGTPSELVDRHAHWATVQFGCPAAVRWPDGLGEIVGVREVRRGTNNVEVHGDRRMVAHVCADLVRRGEVPDDLSIAMPDLEDALVALLGATR